MYIIWVTSYCADVFHIAHSVFLCAKGIITMDTIYAKHAHMIFVHTEDITRQGSFALIS